MYEGVFHPKLIAHIVHKIGLVFVILKSLTSMYSRTWLRFDTYLNYKQFIFNSLVDQHNQIKKGINQNITFWKKKYFFFCGTSA